MKRWLICLLAPIMISPNAFAGEAAHRCFQVHQLNPESEHHSCAVADINEDGRKDIIAGGWWYEGPNWQRHYVRDVEKIRGRFDDYSHLPLDVNADGAIDFVSVNYRSESLYWVQHPGPQHLLSGHWQTQLIARPGAMETGRLFDIDQDGHLDVLPNGVHRAAWWRLESGQPPVWTEHPLPEELAAHGIGCGDINGDGRADVAGRYGWAEAPEDRRSDRWVFHREFDLGRDASIPILVFDVDSDGDSDLIWGRGHRTGLYWLEQSTTDSDRQWVRHAIDTEWTQAHSLLIGDLDVDGRLDVIAGQRYFGHDGKDVGEYNPLVSYFYSWNAEQRSWHRQTINTDQSVGFGLDPKADDVDLDGDLDLVCADRNGLFLLENQLCSLETQEQSSDVPVPEVRYPDHSQIMILRDQAGAETPITTPEQMGQRRAHILQGMMEAMGAFPGPDRRVPLDVRIESEEQADGYVRKRLTFAAEKDDRVPAYLLIPNNRTERGPAMLCLHQTIPIGKGEPAGLGGSVNLHYAHELAQRGFVCLVPDYPSFGDYEYDFRTKGAHYQSGSMKAIWNNVRAVDLLESLPEVDPDRIGCVGHSLGGHNTLFTAAFDQRIRAAVTSCGFTAFHHYYNGNLNGWTSDRYMPRIRTVYGNDPNQVPFDFYEVLAAIAPRNIFVSAPVRDDNFENTGVRKVVDEVRNVFRVYGSDEQSLIARYPECAHDFPPEVREEAWKWLEDRLRD